MAWKNYVGAKWKGVWDFGLSMVLTRPFWQSSFGGCWTIWILCSLKCLKDGSIRTPTHWIRLGHTLHLMDGGVLYPLDLW